MDREVPELRADEAAEEGVDLDRAWAGVQRMVDVVGDVGRESPVVAAVLEQVHDGHRGVAEPVDKHSLEQSLCVVQHPVHMYIYRLLAQLAQSGAQDMLIFVFVTLNQIFKQLSSLAHISSLSLLSAISQKNKSYRRLDYVISGHSKKLTMLQLQCSQ